MKIRIDQLKPGMVIETSKGLRTIKELRKVNETPLGDVYLWGASRAHPKQLPYIAARGDLTIEVING